MFSTASAGGVQLDFSTCASSLYLSRVDWKLVDVASGATIASDRRCESKLVPNVPAGDYRLELRRNGSTGTYKVGILAQPAPQQLALSLPASVSNGVPAAGAGNLETTASEDQYVFSTASAGGVQLDFSTCASSLYLSRVDWKLVAVASGATIASDARCESKLAPNLPAGDYRLEVRRNGSTGTYRIWIGSL